MEIDVMLEKVLVFLKSVRVVAGNLLPYLLLLQTGLTYLVASGELNDIFPEYAQYGVSVLTAIGFAISFIRRVTPVQKDERGILPPGTP